MGLKDRMKRRAVPKGFQFAQSEFRSFSQLEDFRRELHDQAASVALLDAREMTQIDLDGRVLGVEDNALRLTRSAFGHLCHICRIPRAYVDQLACRDDQLALSLVEEALGSMLHRNETKVMVVDSRTNLVHAIIDRDSYNTVSNETVLDLALSAMPAAQLNRGFVDGPNARITIVDPQNISEPKIGDVVRIGVDLMTDIGSESIVTSRSYNERLRCLNGMTVADRAYVNRLSARNDVQSELPDALMRTVGHGIRIGPMMKESARLYLDESGIDRMTDYLSDPRNGGNSTLLREAVTVAQQEARSDGREDSELTLWDFVNGVTAAAKSARTLHRRVEVEGMGYNVMSHFIGLEVGE